MEIIPLPILKLNFAFDGGPGTCSSLCSMNNFPQGVTDVIQILDFQHFKVSASGSLNDSDHKNVMNPLKKKCCFLKLSSQDSRIVYEAVYQPQRPFNSSA